MSDVNVFIHYIGPKKHKNVAGIKNIKTFITSMLGATNVVIITSEWSSILYDTHMTDVTGLENGSFSYVVTNQVEVVAVGSQNCYQWQTS